MSAPGKGRPAKERSTAVLDVRGLQWASEQNIAAAAAARSPQEATGRGGLAEMSMASMVADMRNRFGVAALFSVPILVWSPIGRGPAAC